MVQTVILHDLRSIHNVGSILRTCDGFGIKRVYIGGTSPYPKVINDERLPHIIERQTSQIAKTSLGAETQLALFTYSSIHELLDDLSATMLLVALEQTENSINISRFRHEGPIALLLGREVEGIEPTLLKRMGATIEIPMIGTKESFNVAVATGIALYALQLS